MNKSLNPQKQGGADDYQTPSKALDPLLEYLHNLNVKTIWEPACGEGSLVRSLRYAGFTCYASDIKNCNCPQQLLLDFLKDPPLPTDCIITNPPYSLKNEFLERCYELRTPFALLLPLTCLETSRRQRLFRTRGLELILMAKRIEFKVPRKSSSSPWFATAWFTWGLQVGRQLTFSED